MIKKEMSEYMTGAKMLAQTFSDSGQGVISLSVGSQSAGTKIILSDKNGNVILEHSPELSYEIVILSLPELKKGEEYHLKVGKSDGTFEAD